VIASSRLFQKGKLSLFNLTKYTHTRKLDSFSEMRMQMRDSRTVLTCPLSIYKRIYSRLFIHEYLAWQQLHPMTPMRYIVLKTLSKEHAQCLMSIF